MRTLLNSIYDDIRIYEELKVKDEKEIKNLELEIKAIQENLEKEIGNLTKIEKIKKEMDLSYLESKLELKRMNIEKNISNEEIKELKEKITLNIGKMDSLIYILIRTGELRYTNAFTELKNKYGDKRYQLKSISSFFENNHKKLKDVTEEKMEDFLSIYEYYKKVSELENEIIKNLEEEMLIDINLSENKTEIAKDEKKQIEENSPNSLKRKEHLKKLEIVEELIDEMAREIINEDMRKNNVILPEFIKDRRYFKVNDK